MDVQHGTEVADPFVDSAIYVDDLVDSMVKPIMLYPSGMHDDKNWGVRADVLLERIYPFGSAYKDPETSLWYDASEIEKGRDWMEKHSGRLVPIAEDAR